MSGPGELRRLPTFAGNGDVHVVIETPRGARAKMKYREDADIFAYQRPLARGLCYPYDWGFVPGTRGEDGDPLDGMVLHDGATYPGIVIASRPLAILEVEQTQDGKTIRNDRILFRPAPAPRDEDRLLLAEPAKRELEQFFVSAVLGMGKTLRFRGWKGPDEAVAAIRRGAAIKG